VIFSLIADDAAPSPGEVMVVDFDHANAAGYSMTWSGAGLYQGALVSGIAAPRYGDQSIPATNRRFEFTFDPNDLINQVIFSSSGNSFEFDNIAVNDPPAPIPEPVTLSLFAAGLAGVAGLRRRKTVTA